MHSTIETWIDELVNHVDNAQASAEFQEWLDVQRRFHDYSHRNTLLIKRQRPDATKVAGYNTWRNEFDRHVQKGDQAIRIWAPIITTQCPESENSPSYHEQNNCEYDEASPIKFKNVPDHSIRTTVNDDEVLVDNRKLLRDHGIAPSPVENELKQLETGGETTVLVALNGRLLGIVADVDTIKESATKAVTQLREHEIDVWMITGNNERTAHVVAEQVVSTQQRSGGGAARGQDRFRR